MADALRFDVAARYDRRALDEAEIKAQERLAALKHGNGVVQKPVDNNENKAPNYKTNLVQQIEQARQKIHDAISATEAKEVKIEDLPSPESETPVSSEPATPLTPSAPRIPDSDMTPTTPSAPDEPMTKSKRKRERKKRKARAAADAAARAPTTPTSSKPPVGKTPTPTRSDQKISQTMPLLSNNAREHVSKTTPVARAKQGSAAARPTDIQPINAVVTTNNNNPPIIGRISTKQKNHVILDLNDPETIQTYVDRVESLEQENRSLKNTVSSLQSSLKALEDRVKRLELGSGGKPAAAPAKKECKKEESDDDVDLFGSDDDEPVAKPAPKQAAKKPAKAGPIAKSLIQLYVKPWDDETDMKEMEKMVRGIVMDGLVWGASQLVPVGYGIKKLQIACVVEDEKVGMEDLEEKITAFEDLVQSVDVASFNKI